jgi:hypothetical protein
MYSPVPIENAPATREATPVSTTVCADTPPPPRPEISDALVTSPSTAPNTVGRSRPPETSRCPCDSPRSAPPFEGQPVGVLAGGKLVLLERGGREAPDQRPRTRPARPRPVPLTGPGGCPSPALRPRRSSRHRRGRCGAAGSRRTPRTLPPAGPGPAEPPGRAARLLRRGSGRPPAQWPAGVPAWSRSARTGRSCSSRSPRAEQGARRAWLSRLVQSAASC